MGYENRDYARDDTNRGWTIGGASGEWPVWKKILVANIVVFLLQIFFTRAVTVDDLASTQDLEGVAQTELRLYLNQLPSISVVQEWFELDSGKVFQGQIWRVVTAGFCHSRDAIFHIVFNMLFLVWFGSKLEARYGGAEFTLFYFAALLASSLAYIAMDLYSGVLIPAIGASGAVWGIVALYALLYPYETINIYFLFPVPIWLMALLYFLYDLHPVLLALSGDRIYSGVGHAAHVGGAVFGFVYYRYQLQLSRWFNGLEMGSASKRQKKRWANSHSVERDAKIIPMHGPYKTFDSDQEERMDAILEKISNEGRDSLTEEEEKFLLDASEKIRNR